MSKEIYSNYSVIIEQQKEAKKELGKKITNYQTMIQSGSSNTISIENGIEKDIQNLKSKKSELENAYSITNAPSFIPTNELDKRQKDIQQLGNDVSELENSYKNIKNQKYSFKGKMSENYELDDNLKNLSNSELRQAQQEKIKQQDNQIGDIIVDVKKGRVLAKEAGHTLEEQNKQLDELQEEVDQLDSKFKRGIKRFENYVVQQKTCCLTIILIIEIVGAFLIYFFLINNLESSKDQPKK